MDFNQNSKISVVIPTRNRESELLKLLDSLYCQDYDPRLVEIIIIDSSDVPVNPAIFNSNAPCSVTYKHTLIRSAAIQRNIGIDSVRQDCDFLFFLDDDVIVSKDYLCVMTSAFSDEYVVGVSGIASNVEGHFETEDAWLAKIYKYFFMLDSRIDGAILSSGVSIPVRRDGVRQAQWLIGCAAWRYRNLGVTRFESDMYGYTLGEDVIFSVRMSQKGRLLVLTNIVIDHKESPKGRPGACDFWCSWMTYRWRLVSLGSLTWQKRSSYWWASFGQLIINLVGEYCLHNKPTGSSRGILQGAMQIIRRVQN